MIRVDMFEGMGRGVVAARDIKKGETIEVCEILILSEQDTIKVNETDLQYYTFKFNDKQDCLVLGLGEIYNHSDNASVSYQIVEGNGRSWMVFTTNTDIKENDQLFIDYNQDTRVDVSRYTINL